MSLPIDLIFVRHGQSAANEHYHKVKDGEAPDDNPNVSEKFQDAEILLTELGKKQARAAGGWLRKNTPPHGFDRYYASPFYRTRQTAALLGLNGQWRLDDRLREQDWAEFLTVLKDENRARLYPFSYERYSKNFWYWAPPSGESKSNHVRARIDSWFATLGREVPDETVIAVTHGGAMDTVRFLIERLTFDGMIKADIPNCAIMWYSRRNPTSGEISDSISWRRVVCPWDSTQSWDNGDWVKLDLEKKVLSDKQLLDSIKKHHM
jgi:broad specificity phosphatase PhoE